MLKRKCALYFLLIFLLPSVWKQIFNHGRRQCVLQTELVYSIFDGVDDLQNVLTFFFYFRYEDHVEHVNIVKLSYIRFSAYYWTRKHHFVWISFIYKLPRLRETTGINFFCKLLLALTSLTSLGSLTAIEIQFWICINATKVLEACEIDHAPAGRGLQRNCA